MTGDPIRLQYVQDSGKPPSVFGRCFVPHIVGVPPKWYMRGANRLPTGIKCYLNTESKERLFEKYGILDEYLVVTSLNVVQVSKSGDSVIVEIASF